MFEHADRNDPVEGALDIAIVEKLEAHLSLDTRLLRPPSCHGELLFGQGNTEDRAAGDLVNGERRAAPTAADIERGHARRQMQFGEDMRKLMALGRFQVGGRIVEIGATILKVAIEEEVVEPVRQVVVVRNIAASAPVPIEPAQSMRNAPGEASGRAERLKAAAFLERIVRSDEIGEIADIALLDNELPVHESFARPDPRIAQDFAHRSLVRQPDRYFREPGSRFAITALFPVITDDRQRALFDQVVKEPAE